MRKVKGGGVLFPLQQINVRECSQVRMTATVHSVAVLILLRNGPRFRVLRQYADKPECGKVQLRNKFYFHLRTFV